MLNKVTTGQADAGLVYITDARGAGDKVTAVAFPEAADAVNTYPIAALKTSETAELAHKFIEAVTGAAGQKTLRAAARLRRSPDRLHVSTRRVHAVVVQP